MQNNESNSLLGGCSTRKASFEEFLYGRRMCFLPCQQMNVSVCMNANIWSYFATSRNPSTFQVNIFRERAYNMHGATVVDKTARKTDALFCKFCRQVSFFREGSKTACVGCGGRVLTGNGQPSHPRNPSHVQGKSVWLPHGYFESFGVSAL